MAEVTIYHNPHCAKSRQTLRLLRERGIQPRVVRYLETPPDEPTVERLLAMLGMEPQDLMRRKEDEYLQLGLAGETDRRRLVRAMVEHPILIERPIVVKGDQARLGRPPEQVLEIL
ncbi:MAG: arsenate reductase (glutaredoxin) [Candidatus Latescibacterota bacterium]